MAQREPGWNVGHSKERFLSLQWLKSVEGQTWRETGLRDTCFDMGMRKYILSHPLPATLLLSLDFLPFHPLLSSPQRPASGPVTDLWLHLYP